NEIVNARFLCRKALSEFGEVLWKILHTSILHIGVSGVKCIASINISEGCPIYLLPIFSVF
ncbi:MAG: hypothetical protein C4B58_10620, partial [Deltaproteobacteria bacterium]